VSSFEATRLAIGNQNRNTIEINGENGAITLGVGGPGGSVVNRLYKNDALTRGQAGVNISQPDLSTDFSPWGGFISFNKDYSHWFFDTTLATDDDIGAQQIDFLSVAVHEMAHVLGFGTADSFKRWVTGDTYDGPNTPATPLDGYDFHWLEGTTSTIHGVSFEAAMDPSIDAGQRKLLTDLDWNALRDIGWQVSPAPEPGTWAMLLAGLGLVGWAARRRRA